ncbi:DUF3459 domain-containing protein [Streptomyces sp. NPDC050534]|uniref:DUF3459 domain-containing protein n=1 Tax=Streptomyces sp. NPDC050534 TaxID=3365625 RepID=UPI0037A25183
MDGGRNRLRLRENRDTWLRQVSTYGTYAARGYEGDPDLTLQLFRRLLTLRRCHRLGAGELHWCDSPDDVLHIANGAVEVMANLSPHPVTLPAGARILTASAPTAEKLSPEAERVSGSGRHL